MRGDRRSLRCTSTWLSRLVGAVAALAIHALFLQSISLGSLAKKSAPDQTGPGASTVLSSDGAWMSMVIVHLPGVGEVQMAEKVSSRGEAFTNPVIQIISPDATPSFEIPEPSMVDESGDAATTAGDTAMQSMLFGRYTGQIDARIQRAWRKPRTPIDATRAATGEPTIFRCQARIKQDEFGAVKEVELSGCNGPPDWQLSLVRAIQRSSPLPAPPNPSVFTNVLTMSFEGRQYAPGYRDDEYEPAIVRAATQYVPPVVAQPESSEPQF
jgi:hypothetical protein